MILAIDIGNTNIDFGIYSEDNLLYRFRMQSDLLRTTDEYAVSILYLLEKNSIDLKCIKGAIIASVVPSLTYTISRFTKKYINIEAVIVGVGIKTGVSIRLENPKEIGADRIINAVATINKYNSPSIIIDFGTATTIDIVNGNKEYIGGIICPGVKLSAKALHSNTAKLPDIDIIKPKSVIGKNTTHSMHSGIYYGYLEMINGLLDRVFEEEFINEKDVKVIVTGGLGSVFVTELKYDAIYESELTLYGLKVLYYKNNLYR